MKHTLKSLILLVIIGTLFSSFITPEGKIAGKFEVGDKTFLLNGKPFIIKAAEIHYTRIPAAYWEHRIKMCKALGMNTICIYGFWNIHEQTPGKFDFKGQNDVAQFCRLAQKNGMYIMLRPGPYVCSEWEMGGLPWWLLKKKGIKLRSDDTYFLERTQLFMNEMGKQLADMQISRGGNIIMVQVENEYSAFAQNKPYIAKIRDIVKGAGFNEVPLFQCDWSSTFKLNALDDLLWTLNFGTGANIEKQFEELKRIRPNTPLMCSEFWSGWFDNWGRKHETRSAKTMVSGIKDMLDRNISFSLYMTHGGSTFGHWGGANSPAYSAMCSSYDYDAPISEAGWITPKYTQLRGLLSTYLQKGEKLTDIPAPYHVIEIPEIHFDKVAPLFDNLPKANYTKEIRPMEEFNQGYGTILYRTRLPEINEATTLLVTEVHDWAQVFINGKYITTLDRRKSQYSVAMPKCKAGDQLDILVEAMGRVNFGEAIYDHKGITEKVELITASSKESLEGWSVYSFPTDSQFAMNKDFKSSKSTSNPAYYKASFNLNEVGDTFLDLQTWGKGMVWVNGIAMGRFWEIGPQQTLFMPGCWLKKGKNEIVILDLKGPKQPIVKGVKLPILDMLRPEEPLTHRKAGESLNLLNATPLFSGTFINGNGWKEVSFGNIYTGRYFCMEALNGQTIDQVAAVAELYLKGEDGKSLSRENWKIVYADSEEMNEGNCTADKVFDLQESTFWSTDVAGKAKFPHYIVIDLGKQETISGFRYLPRAEQNCPGMIKDYRIFLSDNMFQIDKK